MKQIFRFLVVLVLAVILLVASSIPVNADTIMCGYTGSHTTTTSGAYTVILAAYPSAYEGTITYVQYYKHSGSISNVRFFTAYNSSGSTWVVRSSTTVWVSGYSSEGVKSYTVSLHCHVGDCIGWSSDYVASQVATYSKANYMLKVNGEYSDVGDSASYTYYGYCLSNWGGQGTSRVILTIDNKAGSNISTLDNIDWTVVKSVDSN
jgi:hypothetical protein